MLPSLRLAAARAPVWLPRQAALCRGGGASLVLPHSRHASSPAAFSGAALAVRSTKLASPLSCGGQRYASTAAVAAYAPPPAVPSRFAVVALSGAQHKVAVGDVICVEKLTAPVGSTINARRVLLVGEADTTIIGSPLIDYASVTAVVEEQGYGQKLTVFKKRRRKGYRRWRGYRARLTMLRICGIELNEAPDASGAASDG